MTTTYITIQVGQFALNVYRVANPGWRWMWNRYGTRTIGIAAVTGRACWAVKWRNA